MTENELNSLTVTPEISASQFQRLVDGLTPPIDEKVARFKQVNVVLKVAANHLAAKTQRQESTK